MGCDSYEVCGQDLHFAETDDDVACLCQFPGTIDAAHVRSLAYLGAAVVLACQGKLDHGIIPGCLPEWIKREIDARIGGGRDAMEQAYGILHYLFTPPGEQHINRMPSKREGVAAVLSLREAMKNAG